MNIEFNSGLMVPSISRTQKKIDIRQEEQLRLTFPSILNLSKLKQHTIKVGSCDPKALELGSEKPLN